MRRLLALSALALGAGAVLAEAPPSDQAQRDRIFQAVEGRARTDGDAWFDRGDYPRVVRLLEFRLALRPSDFEIATDLGWLLRSIEERGRELAVYIRFRRENTLMADAPFPEANFYFQGRAFARVPPLLEPTIALVPPPHPNSFRLLAQAYVRLGFLPDAVRVWDKLLSLTPDDAAARANRDRALERIKAQGG